MIVVALFLLGCGFVVVLCGWFLSFFFFQAEDGIRDWSVTGVQTCALPISCFSFSSSCTKRAIVTGAIDNLPLGSQGDQSNPWAGVGCCLTSPPGSISLGHL